MTLRNRWLGAVPLVAVFAAASPSEADACGGTFCDGGGPQVMAVDQSGENVLFTMHDGVVEAHVQIQYQGDPAQFAWIVPMQAVPEVEVGSQPLFDAVMSATVPTFTLNSRFDGNDCGGGRGGGGFCGAKADDASLAGGDDEGLGESGDDAPDVVVKGTAGAFEYVVLEGGTIDGIVAWLGDNGFAEDDDAPPILAEYLAEGFVFVAFKLRPGTGVDEIHPVILRWQGDEPCVPIRLTRIAATEDMPIRAFFLGERRVVPTNYRHTRINPVRIDWQRVGANYLDVVTLAVDDEAARGRAFVTEFAGRSEAVDRTNVWSSRWDSSRFVGLAADRLIDELVAQGLVICEQGECTPLHPLVPALVDELFAAALDGPTQEAWSSWSALFGADGLDPNDWPDAEFAARFEELLVAPGEHAVDLLDGNPYLTRLFTTISPAEMIEDPLFHEIDGLPDVTNQFSATMVSDCDGPTHIELSDGRRIQLDDAGVAPTFDTMPSAEATEELPPLAGPPIVLTDHRDAIDDELDAWNDAHDRSDGCGCRVAKLRLEGMLLVVLLALGMRSRGRRFA